MNTYDAETRRLLELLRNNPLSPEALAEASDRFANKLRMKHGIENGDIVIRDAVDQDPLPAFLKRRVD